MQRHLKQCHLCRNQHTARMDFISKGPPFPTSNPHRRSMPLVTRGAPVTRCAPRFATGSNHTALAARNTQMITILLTIVRFQRDCSKESAGQCTRRPRITSSTPPRASCHGLAKLPCYFSTQNRDPPRIHDKLIAACLSARCFHLALTHVKRKQQLALVRCCGRFGNLCASSNIPQARRVASAATATAHK